jgi:tetratricopeptide (TPR) repeat protein
MLSVDRSTVARWERGDTEPVPWIRPRLARAMRVPVADLPELLARGGGPPGGTVPGTVLAGKVTPPVPRLLPAAVDGFIGRTAELAALDGVLDEPDGQRPGAVLISAVGGIPGVGKTALALHWAHRAASRFTDGQLYADLRGFDPVRGPATADEVLRRFLGVLGVPPDRIPSAPDARADLYRSLLAGRRMLIVLDNARGERQVRPLLPDSPGCLVLVTSRDPLTGLGTADGAPLGGALLITLDVLTPGEAVELLATRTGRARAGAEPDSVDEIARLCGWLPLALVISAAGAARPGLPLAAVAEELRAAHRRLYVTAGAADTAAPASTHIDGAGRPDADVRAVLSWSYHQLGEAAARMFRLLGLHPGPDITAAAAASLAGVDAAEASGLLRDLCRVCLITEHTPGRYALHDLLRSYALHLARESGATASRAAVGRLLDHYLSTADVACSLITSPRSRTEEAPPSPGILPERIEDSRQAVAWYEAECAGLVAAVALADHAGFDDYAWRLARAMMPFLASRGYHLEWAATQRIGLSTATRLGDVAAQAACARFLAFACTALADHDQAARLFADSIASYERLGDRRGEASAHHGLCLAAEHQGRYADALDHAARAFRLYQETGNETGGIDMINAIAWYRALLGDYERARASCQQALRLSVRAGYLAGQENAWDSLGYAEHRLGNFGAATDCYERGLGLCRQRGNRTDEATFLTHLGDSRLALGEPARAGESWRQAVAILDNLGHPDAARVRAKLDGAQLASA